MLPVEQIKLRMQRIRLSQRELAIRAGRDVDAVNRALNGRTDSRTSTLALLGDVLETEERALLAHLQSIHPAP